MECHKCCCVWKSRTTKIIEDRLRKLAEKYYPTVEEVEKEMNGSARSRVQLFAIRIEHMTGKLVNEK